MMNRNTTLNITGTIANLNTGANNKGSMTAYVNTPKPEESTQLKKWTHATNASLRKIVDDTTDIQFHEMIVALAKSVGCIWSPAYTGTAFRVGTKCIMTNWHVLQGIIDHFGQGKEQNILRHRDVWVQFNYRPGDENNPEKELRFHFAKVEYSNQELDVSVVQLDSQPEKLPPPIRRFGPVDGNDKLHFIGHDRGWTKKLDPDCRVLSPSREEIAQRSLFLEKQGYPSCYEGMEQDGRIHFQCGFQKGASGSPGAVRRGDEMVVVTVLTRGYPGFYYDLKEEKQRSFTDNDLFIEEGIDILAVRKAIEMDKPEVFNDLF